VGAYPGTARDSRWRREAATEARESSGRGFDETTVVSLLELNPTEEGFGVGMPQERAANGGAHWMGEPGGRAGARAVSADRAFLVDRGELGRQGTLPGPCFDRATRAFGSLREPSLLAIRRFRPQGSILLPVPPGLPARAGLVIGCGPGVTRAGRRSTGIPRSKR
jgi:hypothetical protein